MKYIPGWNVADLVKEVEQLKQEVRKLKQEIEYLKGLNKVKIEEDLVKEWSIY